MQIYSENEIYINIIIEKHLLCLDEIYYDS